MKIYDRQTDSLDIELVSENSSGSEEVRPGVVLDLDNRGNVVGIDIEHASRKVDLNRLETGSLPTST